MELREKIDIINTAIKNEKTLSEQYSTTIQEYKNEINQNNNGYWGGNVSTRVFSEIYKICVFVYSNDTGTWDLINPKSGDGVNPLLTDCDRIAFFHHTGNHYNILIPPEMPKESSPTNYSNMSNENKNPQITSALENAKNFVQGEMTRLKNEELLKKIEGAIDDIKMLAVKKVGELKLSPPPIDLKLLVESAQTKVNNLHINSPIPEPIDLKLLVESAQTKVNNLDINSPKPEVKQQAIDVKDLVKTAQTKVNNLDINSPIPELIDLKLLVESAKNAVSRLNIEEPKPIDLEPLVESAKNAMKLKITQPIADPKQVIKEIKPDVPTVYASKRVKSVVDDGPAFSSGVRFGLEGTSANDPDGLAKYFIFPFPLKTASQKGGRIYSGGANVSEWKQKNEELKQYGMVKNNKKWIFEKDQIQTTITLVNCDTIINEINILMQWFSQNDKPKLDITNIGSSIANNIGTVKTNV